MAGERGSFFSKETAKKGGIVAAAAGGVLFFVGGGIGLFLLGAGTYGGAKYLENREGKK